MDAVRLFHAPHASVVHECVMAHTNVMAHIHASWVIPMSGSQNIYKSVHEHESSGGAVALVVG